MHRIRTIIHTGIATKVGILPTAWHAIKLWMYADLALENAAIKDVLSRKR
jgi:hypothetical protein